ncbi:MAG: DUF4282 domain-containing protein [Chromatiales bacterium]|nr:DUF4282 domain-containing protein [Gammaproteobacteria bacterium]MCP5351972.1 DUF4282 domain-containing protein [Chromatiales bacterium]
MAWRDVMQDLPNIFDGWVGFLTFQVFVTPAVLVVIYYLGALAGPWLTARLVGVIRRDGAEALAKAEAQLERNPEWLSNEHRPAEPLRVPPYASGWRLWLIGLVLLVLLELSWRMLFEFLIAFFDMHDALIAIRNQG